MAVDLALFNLILFNFQQFDLKSNIIFHCWSTTALLTFFRLSINENVYNQFVYMPNIGSNLSTELPRRFFKIQRPIVGVFFDMDCPNADIVLNASSQSRAYNEHFHWLIYDEASNIGRFESLFENANLCVNADLLYAFDVDDGYPQLEYEYDYEYKLNRSNRVERFFALYDVYNNGRHIGGKLNMTADRRIVCTSSGCQLDAYLSDLYKRTKFENRNQMTDITLRIAVIVTHVPDDAPDSEKMQFILSDKDPHIDSLVRFGFRQIIIMKDVLKCNFTFIFYDRWSATEADGGGVGALIDEKVDFGSTPNAISENRLKSVTALAETGIFHASCIFRTPRNTGLGNAGEVFLKPFDISVWILFGLLLLLVSILLWIIFCVESTRMKDYLDYAPSLLTSCLITFGTACIQGTYLMPGSIGGRMAYAALAFASFMMYNYYTSVIVAILLGDPIKSDIKTLMQLAESPLEVGFEDIPFNVAYLNWSTIPAVRRLVKRKIDTKKDRQSAFLATADGVRRVRDEPGFVFVFEASTGFALVEKYFKPEEICDLNEILLRPERALSTILKKNSGYKELFRLRMTRLMETGINRRHLQYWLRDRLHCFASSLVVDVGLEYTAPLFILMLFSYVFCAVVVFFERLVK